jgi:hypothetical protein
VVFKLIKEEKRLDILNHGLEALEEDSVEMEENLKKESVG